MGCTHRFNDAKPFLVFLIHGRESSHRGQENGDFDYVVDAGACRGEDVGEVGEALVLGVLLVSVGEKVSDGGIDRMGK